MSRIGADNETEALNKCRYRFPLEVIADVRKVRDSYRDLHLFLDFYSYSNGEKKQLVNLSGTLPILYQGNIYNIPVCIWLHDTHPQSPPKCFVKPSACMVINSQSRCVDKNGHVFLHYLHNWKHGTSNLLGVVEEMRAAFQTETPVFARVLSSHQPPTPLQPGSTRSSACCEPSRMYFPGTRPSHYSGSPVFHQNASTIQNKPLLSPAQCSADSHAARDDSSSHADDFDDLFKSLQLENVLNIYKLDTKAKGFTTTMGEQFNSGPSPQDLLLVDDRHKIEVSRLPGGLPEAKMKNKLTIYFQRRKNGGGDVLGVQYPCSQPNQACVTFCDLQVAERVTQQEEHVITLNNHKFPIQVKQYERPQVNIPVPEGVPKEKSHVFQSLLTLEGRSFSVDDVMEAVQSNRDYDSALRYLSHECPICRDLVSFSKIITMTHCSCAFCEECFKAYFSSVIKEKSIVHVVCPICNQPDVKVQGCTEETMDFFNLLDTQIKHFLEPQIHELFQRKLRDRTLLEMPNFRWCAHCSFGLLHEAERLRMDCPSCGKSTCSQCKTPWAPQHEGITCEKFKEWQLHNNPEYQAARLEHILSRNKIDCPNCRFRFYLSKGGCLHFKCTQCQYEFCGGCNRPFHVGSACRFSEECRLKGLHAHHPRNCLFYLRDWPVRRLQQLFIHHKVSYSLQIRGGEAMNSAGKCSVLEHRETESGLVEKQCGRPAPLEYKGHCELHYKEFLVELINSHLLDPAVLFSKDEAVSELRRFKVTVPGSAPEEPDQSHLHRLRQKVIKEIQLSHDPTSPQKAVPGPSLNLSAGPTWAAPGDRRLHDRYSDLHLLLLQSE
ncbi:E3 ubiquitin-protein ligase lubel isoform X2 [Amia ocellicauda]|uniref:E3 ubiquitin-protein ligase lubel isoform X2 n=1 Tax=Amia ocellicauda TaxID=2972642 RepID=UPI003463D745